MKTINMDVVVIDGGSTRAGVVRDVAIRGFRTILVEQYDIVQGTSGRLHGLLHPGGRCIASSSESATECAERNEILRRINSSTTEAVGGLFVVTSRDDEEYAGKFLERTAATKIPAQEINPRKAFKREPRLDPSFKRALETLDGAVDGWQISREAIRPAQAYGAETYTYRRVEKVEWGGDRISAVVVHNFHTGGDLCIECSFVLDCDGP